MDLIYIGLIIVFFISAWLFLQLCESLMGGEK